MEIKSGKATRDKTDDWICNNEKIFKAIKYTEEQILFFATYMLAREAEYGLHNLQMRMNAEREVCRRSSRPNSERYFPTNARLKWET